MKIIKTKLPGVLIIEPKISVDSRGFLTEMYHKQRYEDAGIPGKGLKFVQDNYSRSQKKVLRGLHFQHKNPQGKLISVSAGIVFDVVVDVNPDSANYGEWVGIEISEENHLQVWAPPGYAHGFCVLSEVVDFQYKCTDLYYPEDQKGVIWNDPSLAIKWPIENPLLSEKDKALPRLSEAMREQQP